MGTPEIIVGDDHPLQLELQSLRNAVERYQHEAHATSVKLQRHSLDTSHALERTHALETENAKLREELETLRANPDSTPHPTSLQVPELTLALRKLSDKLTATEETLLARTAELLHTRETLSQAHHDSSAARELVKQARAQEEAARERGRQMALKAKAAEEERKMTDFVVQEYADLVRSLQGQGRAHSRNPSASGQNGISNDTQAPPTPAESLAEGKTGLQRLLSEFNGESEKQASELHRLQGEIDLLTATLDVERLASGELRTQLADALVQMDKYKADDTTATKMVSRYMKFSQSSTDSLQKAMDTLRLRHASSTSTLNFQIEQLQKDLLSERRETETLRRALDELSEDISRESYGRRREISLRLSFLSREENLAEHLRRWIRKSRELVARATTSPSAGDSSTSHEPESPLAIACEKIIKSAEGLLETLNGHPVLDGTSSGSMARLVAAKDAVATLTQELQYETNRRLRAELQVAGVHATSEDLTVEKRTPLVVGKNKERKPGARISHTNGQIEKPSISTISSTTETSPAVSYPEPNSSLNATPTAASGLISPISPNNLNIVQLPESDTPEPEPEPEVQDDQPPTPVIIPLDPIPVQEKTTYTPASPAQPEPIDLPSESATPAAESEATILTMPMEEDPHTPTTIVEEVDSSTTIPDIVVALAESEYVALESPTPDAASEPRDPGSTLSKSEETSLLLESSTSEASEPPSEVVAPTPVSVSPSVEIIAKSTGVMDGTNPDSSPAPPTTTQPSLIEALAQVKHRYDDLQKAFRDCHIALRDLKSDIDDLPSRHITVVLKTAVERLDDYNEDTRVELEIRVSDEERIYAGYEALLSIPGAMSEEVDAEQMERDIRAFIDGSDSGVSRALHQFSRKLDDLQHDVASVKQTLHEVQASEEESQAPSVNASPSWTAWTGGLLGSTRPASPTPSFGSVMTSPRLRHASSLSQIRRAASEPGSSDPFAGLGLRIPMPTHLLASKLSSSAGNAGGGLRPQPRPRTVSSSAMYMLGFGGVGARKSGFGVGGPTPPSRTPSMGQSVPKVEEVDDSEAEGDGDGGGDGGDDSDVE